MLKEVGYLSIRVGPMRSGKTHWLHSHATRYADIGESVVYINSVLDDPDIRKSAGGDGVNYTSHSSSNKSISSLVTNVKVSELSECNIDRYDVVCVDEGQFYDDLYETVLDWVLEKNKHVLVVSLDGSYRQKLIGDVTKLLPISNEFEKMSAICMKCIKERSEISHRFRHSDANVTILESQICNDSSDILPEKLLAPLKPLIITQQNYLENILIPNDEVPSKVATSVYRSVPHPLPNCKYISWSQISPPDRGTYGLSWLIDPNPGSEVIQFLTGQLNYRVEYTITNPSRSRYIDGRMRLILVVPNSNVGYEPWDVNGKRIEFEIPIPNRSTRGCFILPGMYSQFIIESPSRLLEMELRVTGYIPEVDKYEAGQFCLNTDDNRFVAYSNVIQRFGLLHREFNPLLSDYADRVIEEFTSDPAQSCYTTTTTTTTSLLKGPGKTIIRNPISHRKISQQNTVLQQQNSAVLRFEADSTDMIRRINDCASGYLNIPLKSATQGAPPIVSTVSMNGDNTQFLLFLGETYNIHIRRAGEVSAFRAVTPTFNQLVERDLVPIDAQYISGPTLDCDPNQVVWLFYSVANKQPATIQLTPNLPPFANQEGTAIVKLDIRYEGGNQEGLAILEFPEPTAGSYDLVVAPTRGDITYATRINGLVWTWKYSIPTGETLFHTYYGVDQMYMDLQLTTL